MKLAIYMDGNRFIETEFKSEEEFEKIVKENSKTLFGSKTIYFDLKNNRFKSIRFFDPRWVFI